MKFFKCIDPSIDPSPFLEEIDGVADAWKINTGRQEKIWVQREAMAIPLRGARKADAGDTKPRDIQASRWTGGSTRFPLFCDFLREIAERCQGELSRARIVCLPAGRRVYPHIDRGEYYLNRDRYHLVLRSAQGSWLRAGDEEVRMREGELWWFDNKQMHEAFNDGEQDRIHLIFDLLPKASQQPVSRAA